MLGILTITPYIPINQSEYVSDACVYMCNLYDRCCNGGSLKFIYLSIKYDALKWHTFELFAQQMKDRHIL